MASETPDLEEFIDSVQDYIETRIELSKLQAIEKSSQAAGNLAIGFILLLLALLILILLSFSLAYAFSEWFGRMSEGFLAVAAVYIILAILIYYNREKWIKKSVVNSVIRSFLNE